MSSEIADVKELLVILPHRYPFLLVDRVLSVEPGKGVVAIKNVSVNEPFFQGHFPGHPIVPGVLLVEAMAQAAGVLIYQTDPARIGSRLFYLAALDNVKFRRPVVPGDQVRLEIEVLRRRSPLWRFQGKALVGEALAAEAEITISETEKPRT